MNKSGLLSLKIKGSLAFLCLLAPIVFLTMYMQEIIYCVFFDIVVLYLAVGRKSLIQHALNIFDALNKNNVQLARKKLSLIVSRDVDNLNEKEVVVASIESVIENSSDAIFAAIFWYVIAGAPGVVMYRLTNTLDAMWGYKSKRFLCFGWFSAKFDDALNWVPSRLIVFSFAVLSHFNKVWFLSFEQGMKCSSKNAGPVMAAGACALNIKLGGTAYYNGKKINKPELGCGKDANALDIKRALKLIDKVLLLWWVIFIFIGFILELT